MAEEDESKCFKDTQWLSDLISELQDVISHHHMDQVNILLYLRMQGDS